MKYLVINASGTISEITQSSNKVCDISELMNNKPKVVWKYKKWNIGLYGKTQSQFTSKTNKYDFPPPIDNVYYVGNCILVNLSTKKSKIKNKPNIDYETGIDLTINEWNIVYEKLFGGFESIDEEDDDDDTPEDNINVNVKRSHGYLVDDFLVDDNDELL